MFENLHQEGKYVWRTQLDMKLNRIVQLVAGIGSYSTAIGVAATPIDGFSVVPKRANDPACSSVSSLSAAQASATPSGTSFIRLLALHNN